MTWNVSLHYQFDDASGVIKDSRVPQDAGRNSNDINAMIDVFEDRVEEWFLKWGEYLKPHHNAGYVVLLVACMQIEGVQQLREGKSSKGSSGLAFGRGMHWLFPEQFPDPADAKCKSDLDNIYNAVRNGLAHNGFTKPGVFVENTAPQVLTPVNGTWLINPNKFLDRVTTNIREYIQELRRSKDLQKNFKAVWLG